MHRLGRRLGALIETTASASVSWALPLALIGASPGLALWAFAHPSALAALVDNKLPQADRLALVAWAAVALLFVLLAYLLVWVLRHRRNPALPFGEHVRSLNRYTFSAVALPCLAFLRYRTLETTAPFFTLTLIAVSAGCAAVLAYRVTTGSPRSLPEVADAPRDIRRALPWVVTTAVGVTYALLLTRWSIMDHHNLLTNHLDLAIYDNIAWNMSELLHGRGSFLGCSFCAEGTHASSHFDPILLLVGPLYALSPRAETILAFQSWWLALGVLPAHLLAARRLRLAWAGPLFAAVYALSPAVQGINMYDFHSLALAVPLILWVIYLCDAGGRWTYWVALALLLTVREDMAFLACLIAVYAALTRRPLLGLSTAVVALCYLVVVKSFLMTSTDLLIHGHFVDRYASMIPHKDENLKGLALSLLTNPVFALKTLFTPEAKVFYYAAVLVPLLGFPLAARTKLVPAVYGVIFIGLADLKFHFSLYFQYSTVLVPALFAATPEGIARVASSSAARAWGLAPRRLAWASLIGMVVASGLASWKLGVMGDNAAFTGGFQPIVREPGEREVTQYWKLLSLVESIPSDGRVCATDRLTPHISNRKTATAFPRCGDANYLLTWDAELPAKEKQRLASEVTKGTWQVAENAGPFTLYRRP